MKMATNSSTGSIQNVVRAKPPQLKVLSEPRLCVPAKSVTTANPRPKPQPSLSNGRQASSIWLMRMSSTVFEPRRRSPSSSPLLSNIWQKRR